MNFLIKIEDAINRLLIAIFDKCVALIPQFVFDFAKMLRHLPGKLFHLIKSDLFPKLNLLKLKAIGYTAHYLSAIFGIFTFIFIYLKSEEFKKANKIELLLTPIRFAKAHPFLATLNASLMVGFIVGGFVIFRTTNKIVTGTKALRHPASVEAEVDLFVEHKNVHFEVEIGKKGAEGVHGNLILDIKLEAVDENEKKYIEKMEESVSEVFEDSEFSIDQLPITAENQKKIEDTLLKALNEELADHGHEKIIKTLSIKQIPPGRPLYYGKLDRIVAFKDVNLQIFLEETKRNRQVYLDFTVVCSNRNTALFIKDHEIEIKDLLNVNVEPILHKLMLEDEGRGIIKDKIRDELNEFIKAQAIEGRVQEIYIESLISS